MDLSKTKLDDKAEREGIWIDYDEETAFLVARWMNPDHKAFIQRAVKPYIRKHRRGDIPQDVSERIEAQAMAECILLGWKGLKNAGQDIPFSKGEALKLLSDPAQSWLYSWVQEEAMDMASYQVEALAEGVENVGES